VTELRVSSELWGGRVPTRPSSVRLETPEARYVLVCLYPERGSGGWVRKNEKDREKREAQINCAVAYRTAARLTW
jgi:hypothetical protein